MKNKYFLFLIMLLIAAPAWSQNVKGPERCRTCGKLKKACPYKGNHPKSTKYLKVDGMTDNLYRTCYTATGCEYTFSVSSNAGSYTVTSNVGWITVKDRTNNSFTVVIGNNRGTSKRDGRITVSADNKTVSIDVMQYGSTAKRTTYLLVDGKSDREQFIQCDDPLGCQSSFTVGTDSSDYLVYGIPSWVQVISKSLDSFTIAIQENESDSVRDDYFLVRAGSKQVKINVMQVGRRHQGNKIKGIVKGLEYRAGAGLRVSNLWAHAAYDNLLGSFSAGIGSALYGEVQYHFKDALYFASGLAVSFHNYSGSFSYSYLYLNIVSDQKYHLVFLDIPLLAVYKYALPVRKATLALKGGFLLGFGLSASLSEDMAMGMTSYDLEVDLFDDLTDVQPYNRFSFGLHLGVDFELEKFVVGLSYEVGLSNLANQNYFKYPSNQLFLAPYETSSGLYNYRLSVGSLMLGACYRF